MGTGTGDRKNAFEIYTNGRIYAPELTLALHDSPSSLVTKEYADANASSGLIYHTSDVDYGWAFQCRIDNPLNYGDIGKGAVDFSANNVNGNYGATGLYSFAIGFKVSASGKESFAQGYNTTASGRYSHAEGGDSIASGRASHAEGYNTTASGVNSHTEGYSTTASGINSHAEGYSTTASGEASHAEGYYTNASASNSHAEGKHTIAVNDNGHVAGKYNVGISRDTIHETGIGTGTGDRKNAFEIYTDGTLTAPEATSTEIQARGNQALVTIDYLLSAEFGSALPTTDPGVVGKLWNNAGIVSISESGA